MQMEMEKRAGVATCRSDKVGFKTKAVIKDKKHYMIKLCPPNSLRLPGSLWLPPVGGLPWPESQDNRGLTLLGDGSPHRLKTNV